ncbi:alanine dehydrogenase [Flavipsychrobacter stenotrophus]|uniref:alanine dehydrogenase n=1 Tax=Flavipsychrobacter stenotrophus TaxID=2077091 RepID=A0A2S7SYC9_9BACT|nr:alanine dehydrogenase [Flavipsychrobacter stenotrophus]PQJ11724.1 alanine dehydrogenase [Flavipsychrobacter stenotrophus]
MSKKPYISPSFSYTPLEETLQIIPKKKQLFIGIPKETSFQENRVPLTPEGVSVLINQGHDIAVEHGAGEGSFYFDNDYSEVGARIVYDKAELYKATTILKSAPISEEEAGLLQVNQVVISPIHMPMLKTGLLEQLISKKIIAIAFESIMDENGSFPIVRSMSEIAGNYAILTAARYLGNTDNGKGVLLGGISGVPPARVLIIGAGIVAEFAARAAFGLGASVKIFDNSIYRLMKLQNNIGRRCFTSVIDPVTLAEELRNADVAIGALKPINGVTPMVVSEQMVSNMKAGSVIIDVSIDRGGCFETSRVTSHERPVYKKYDVIHYCVPNIASGVSRTASRAISNVLMPILQQCADTGGVEEVIQTRNGIRNGVYLYKGCVTNAPIAKKFGFKYTDLDLLFTGQF